MQKDGDSNMYEPISFDYQLIFKALELEKQFALNNYFGYNNNQLFQYKQGVIPIVVSAPHAVKQVRNGLIKDSDLFTGSLALLLENLTGCHVIYRTSTGNGDSNKDENCRYKNFLLSKIEENSLQCLIDLHGIHKKRNLLIDVGTLNGLSINKEIENIIVKCFKGEDIHDVHFNQIFDANKKGTVVKTIWQNSGIPSFQLEINGQYRDIYNKDNWDKFNKIVKSLMSLILNLNYYFHKDNQILH